MTVVAELPSQAANAAKVSYDRLMIHTQGVHSARTHVNVDCVTPCRDKADMKDVRTTGQILTELVARAGLSMRSFAKACGYATASGVQRYMDESFDSNISLGVITRMARALVGKGDPPIQSGEVFYLVGLPEHMLKEAPSPNGTPIRYEGASIERMRQDVPILGTALGADRISDNAAVEQTYLFSDEVIGYAKRPVILDGRADVYGIYVQGSSMWPAYEDGTIVFAETKRPPRIGDSVIIYLRRNGEEHDGDDGASARTVLVKRLVKRSASYIELEQYNPRLTFQVDTKEVLKMHRVLTMNDLLS